MKSLKKFIIESSASQADIYSSVAAFFSYCQLKNYNGKLKENEFKIVKSLLHCVLAFMDNNGYLNDVDFDKFEKYLLDKIKTDSSILNTMSAACLSPDLYEDINTHNGTGFIDQLISDLYDGYLENIISNYLDK